MAATWTPIWLTEKDIEDAINRATLLACFDDGNGNFEASALASIIKQAEVEVMSWLGDYGPPPFSAQTLAALGADYFLRSAALEYAKYFVFDRHPEYLRTSATAQQDRLKKCEERMERILDARQRPAQTTQPTTAVGGATVDNGARIYVDNADGTTNSGDY